MNDRHICVDCAYDKGGSIPNKYSMSTKDYCYYCNKYCDVKKMIYYDWPKAEKIDYYAD